MTMCEPLKFYCAWYCPFAQRVWMALLLKKIPFEYIEVDPYQESNWWLRISRNQATVPVIIQPADNDHGEFTVVDSSRILEYLEDSAPQAYPLFGNTPEQRAEQRYWMDHINNSIIPNLYRFLQSNDLEKQDRAKDQMILGLSRLNNVLPKNQPYFEGEQFGLIDLLLLPFAYRIDVVLSHYRNFTLPSDCENWDRYQQWFARAQLLDVFQTTSTAKIGYRERLIKAYAPK